MGSTERLCLRWNDFESNIKHGFSELREEEEFFDVTLACGSKQIKAHKVILSACSPFFRSIIKSVPHQHPLLYLRGIKFNHLESLLCFMYNGEVNVTQEELNNFLSVAEELKIKGLTQQNQSPSSPPHASPTSHSHSTSHSSHSADGPPTKRPRIINKVSSSPGPTGQTAAAVSSAANSSGNGGARNRIPTASTGVSSQRTSAGPQAPVICPEEDDIEDITHVKAEPKDTATGGNTMVVTPDVSLGPDDLVGEDAYAHEDENYEEYAQYGSDPGEMSYAEGGSMLDPGLAAVPGPSGAPTAADGNKDYDLAEYLDLVNEIEEFISQRSIHGGKGKYFECLVCRIRPRDTFDNRKHLITHITKNHDLFIGEKPGLLNRIDAYITPRIFEKSDGNFICLICKQALGSKFIPLRKHFLLNHLKRRIKKANSLKVTLC